MATRQSNVPHTRHVTVSSAFVNVLARVLSLKYVTYIFSRTFCRRKHEKLFGWSAYNRKPLRDELSSGCYESHIVSLASQLCDPGLNPALGVSCGLNWLLVPCLAPKAFLRVLRFSSLQENQFDLDVITIDNSYRD